MTEQERIWLEERDLLRGQLRREQDERAALRIELNELKAERENGTVALLRIREISAKTDNEKLKALLAAALEVADTFLLGKPGSPRVLEAMDKLHATRAAAKTLGVE